MPLLVKEEQRPLNVPDRNIEFAREVSNNGQETIPMSKRESRTVRVLRDVADRVQQLPHSDVDDAVPFRFHKRKDSGGHRNSDAGQGKQSLKAFPFTSGAER